MNRLPQLLIAALGSWATLAAAQAPIIDGSSGSLSGSARTTAQSNSNAGTSYGSTSGRSGAYVGGSAAAPVSAEGMLFMQLQQMQDELAQLRGLVEEQQRQIAQLQREGLERYQDLDQRLSDLGRQPAAAGSGAGGAVAVDSAPLPENTGDPAQEKLYYDAAFDLVRARDFARAQQAFSGFLNKYPRGQYAGNAQYWLGEVQLAQGDLPGAREAFSRVLQYYGDHAKVPDALYKLGDVEQRLGDPARARQLFQQVVDQYPNASAAQLARGQLNQ